MLPFYELGCLLRAEHSMVEFDPVGGERLEA
jgi:hypothetical protein